MKESKYCKVISDDNKVIKYQRKIGVVQEYYRSIPEVNILKLLESYTFNIPKIIDESNDGYFVEEYINGDLFDSIYSDYESINKEDIDKMLNYVYDMLPKRAKALLDYHGNGEKGAKEIIAQFVTAGTIKKTHFKQG